jgi:hypothetical protein
MKEQRPIVPSHGDPVNNKVLSWSGNEETYLAASMQPLRLLKTFILRVARRAASLLPRSRRHRAFRALVDCDPAPDPHLVLKLAETREELEACFRLLHDAYVTSDFTKPDPSGMRVTIYDALPTTTIVCAKYDGIVVGTLSLIRESAMGFPLQRIFDLTGVRAKRGNIAEVSALAIHPRFRGTRGAVLFPLMKFLYDYCTNVFATRHLVIAVHPRQIEMFESLLFFRRLTGRVVASYDFVNGAPAVGATLDLKHAEEIFRRQYGGRSPRRNLHRYFFLTPLATTGTSAGRSAAAGNPALTPELVDHFCNRQTRVFADLSDRKKALLHLIYDLPEYQRVLPRVPPEFERVQVRLHRRFPVRCPGQLNAGTDDTKSILMEISEVSRYGFRARTRSPAPADTWLTAVIQLGRNEISCVQARCVQDTELEGNHVYGFQIGDPDLAWRKFVNALYDGQSDSGFATSTRLLSRE